MPDIAKSAYDELAKFSAALVRIDARKRDDEKEYQGVRTQLFSLIDRLAGPDSKLAVEISETGRRIGRTMVYGSPGLDADKLREIIGDEQFEKVTFRTVTYSIDYEAMRDAIRNEEITRSQIEKAIIPGKVGPRLLHSKLGSREDQDVEQARSKSEVEELLEF